LVTSSSDAPFETFDQSIWKSLIFEGPNNVKDLCTRRPINNLPSIHPFQHAVLFHGCLPELISKWSTHSLLPIWIICLACFSLSLQEMWMHQLNSLPAKSILVGEKLVLFGRYVLNFYVGIIHYILREIKTWRAKIYLLTQRTNWRILTNPKMIQYGPSTHVINAASFVKIASNSG
jgi:hypothetical protein